MCSFSFVWLLIWQVAWQPFTRNELAANIVLYRGIINSLRLGFFFPPSFHGTRKEQTVAAVLLQKLQLANLYLQLNILQCGKSLLALLFC